jgi:acyl-CoA synthetase (AMP-forming)/AMP-acid ligase II
MAGFCGVARRAERRRSEGADQPKDIAIQLYTSGTTGKPKGAMLSHANFLNLVQTGEAEKPDWNKWSTDDVSLVAMPIFHIGGSGWGVMGLYHGAKGVIAREFDPTKVLDFFEQSGITKLFMVPAAMQFVVRQPRAREVDFSRLKYMLYGASPIPAALLKECIEVFKCGFVQMYGMTETTGTIVALPPEDHVEGLDRMRSAGKALPGVELAILDADGKPNCRRAKSARSRPAPAPTWSATGICRRRPPRRSAATAGCAPAMPATWTRTAISTSTTASRT